jgi:hypothetical protein
MALGLPPWRIDRGDGRSSDKFRGAFSHNHVCVDFEIVSRRMARISENQIRIEN